MLYVDPDTAVAKAAASATGDSRRLLAALAAQPVGLWLATDWTKDPEATVRSAVASPGLRCLVVYSIPRRDGGSYSAGGAATPAIYRAFIAAIARGLGGRQALVVLEPDGLAHVAYLSASELAERHALLAEAVATLTAAGASVYLDAGEYGWIPPDRMARALTAAGVRRGAGFALNVSHYGWTANQVLYAQQIRYRLGTGARWVCDTGRNGRGPPPNGSGIWGDWLGAGVGERPTLTPGIEGCDAFLWVKPPWEADSSALNAGSPDAVEGGAPGAGKFWRSTALTLAKRAVPGL